MYSTAIENTIQRELGMSADNLFSLRKPHDEDPVRKKLITDVLQDAHNANHFESELAEELRSLRNLGEEMTRRLRERDTVGTEVGNLARTLNVLAARHSDALERLARSLRTLKTQLDHTGTQNPPDTSETPAPPA